MHTKTALMAHSTYMDAHLQHPIIAHALATLSFALYSDNSEG